MKLAKPLLSSQLGSAPCFCKAAITSGGVMAVTDYTGWIGNPDVVPDVVTMNNAHSTHWTANPDPRIPHVLAGWPDANGPAQYELDLGAMLVRNVTTDTRGPFGEGPALTLAQPIKDQRRRLFGNIASAGAGRYGGDGHYLVQRHQGAQLGRSCRVWLGQRDEVRAVRHRH